jgi:hypothetical protein
MHNIDQIPLFVWVIIIIALMTQSIWIFWDASKRGENKWLWGLYGLLNVPSSLLIYLLVTRVFTKPKSCPNCQKKVRGNYKFCPYCGEKTSQNITK